MQISADLFSTSSTIASSLACAGAVLLAIRLAPWRRLMVREQSNVFFGALVALLVLWALRTEVADGLVFHLSAITTLTLMFGWSLAIIGGLVVFVGTVLTGQAQWLDIPVSFLVEILMPVTFTQAALVVVRSALPKHFFIYVFINAFLVGGLAGMFSGYVAALLLMGAGAYAWPEMQATFLPFFPLMFFPEAFLNGWAMTLLVVFRPHWVSSFRDEEYLHGK
jgi:uncharacterized membrane protein